jgi:putative transcriptional regulator
MLRKAAAKKTTFGVDLIEGMNLVLAHQRGKIELEQVWPKPVDVKAIRRRVKMSQAEFSRAYGIGKRALQEWEQGGRQPDSAARAYLTVIAREPAVVRRALDNPTGDKIAGVTGALAQPPARRATRGR